MTVHRHAPLKGIRMVGVLAGIRVVEFTQMVAGPSCGQVLGDLGADVLKVEPYNGDITRRIGPKAGEVSALYASTNRNKSIIRLDFGNPRDSEKAASLAANADVVISNIDSSYLRKAGIDHATLRARNPRLIYVHITGFGPDGPAGTDGLAQAAMGMTVNTGPIEGPGFRTGPSVVDVTTGVWAALGVLAALEHQRQTGEGELIQVSLADTCLHMQYPHLAMHSADPGTVRRNGNHSVVSCTPMLTAADGRLMITILHDRHWLALCEVAGTSDVVDRPEFATESSRCKAQADIERLLNPLIEQKTRSEWVALLREAKVPCAPEQDYSEVEADNDLKKRRMLFRLPDAVDGVLQVGLPVSFQNTPTRRVSELPAGMAERV